MKDVRIKDIKERDRVEGNFLVSKKDLAVTKSGKPYLNLVLMDSSGNIEARAWDNAEKLSKGFDAGDVAVVKGFAVSYQGRLQMKVDDIKAAEAGQFAPHEFLPTSERDPAEMMAELESVIDSLENLFIKDLLKAVFADADIRERFMYSPAAKTMHHTYLGGLIEHVLSMSKLADMVAGHYRGVNRDILLAGAILHDIGKIDELSYAGSFEYTDEGNLLGHITLGVGIVDRVIRTLEGFPTELAAVVKHMILSHHGCRDFGSPVEPRTLEAYILYFLDDMDAKAESIQALTEKHSEDEGKWTPYHRLLARPIFKGITDPATHLPATADEEKDIETKGSVEGDKAAEGNVDAESGEELKLFNKF